MISRILKEKDIKSLLALLERIDRRIVITTHMSPDGDAIGSSLALARILDALGKTVKIVIPDLMLENLKIFPGSKEIIVASRYPEFAEKLIEEAELIFCLDYNALYRTGILEPYLRKATATKVLIDHHLDPETECFGLVFSRPEICSTCMVLFHVICRLGFFNLIDPRTAECILGGMMTDTGNFSYNASDPEIYLTVAELLKKGADKNKLYQALFNTFSANSLRLNGYALSEKMEIFPEKHAALITLSRAELNRFHYAKGDTEGLVNRPLSVPGVFYSAFLREEENYIKVSMRSVGEFPVNILCARHFGGGGHKNAAGGEFKGTLTQCADLFKSLLDQNIKEFITPSNDKPKE